MTKMNVSMQRNVQGNNLDKITTKANNKKTDDTEKKKNEYAA